MRSPVLICCLFLLPAFPGGLHAQEQEGKLMSRLLRPDQELSFRGFERGFQGQKAFYNHRETNQKSFYFKERFRARDYLTGSFQGQQSYWRGDFKYRTGDANITRTENVRRMDREYGTSTAQTRTAHESNRTNRSSGRTSHMSERRTKLTGSSQERFNREGLAAQHKVGWTGDLHQLKTVEDIRDLLNKDQGKK